MLQTKEQTSQGSWSLLPNHGSSSMTVPPSTTPQLANEQHEFGSRTQDNVRPHRHGHYGHLTETIATPAEHPIRLERQPSIETGLDQPTTTSELATKLYTISYLIFFAIWGTLARIGLQALTTYPGAPVAQGVLWANFAGSLVMGFLAEDRKLFQKSWGSPMNMLNSSNVADNKRYMAMKKTIPLYIGLTTGFCGCFTSFSSWQRDAFLAVANAANIPGSRDTGTPIARNGGFSFLALLATLILTPSICLAALKFGAHSALALEPITPGLSFGVTRKVIDPSIAIIGPLSWLATVLLAIWPPDRPSGPSGYPTWLQETWRGDAIFACVFAPLGCLTRYYVSMWLNGKIPSFPLGTFTVNIFGSIVLAVCYDIQRAALSTGIGGGLVGCQVLQGIMDGYCGSTTTISTWVAELNGLHRRHGYIYGAVSTFVALAFMIVIMGSLFWTRGFATTACAK